MLAQEVIKTYAEVDADHPENAHVKTDEELLARALLELNDKRASALSENALTAEARVRKVIDDYLYVTPPHLRDYGVLTDRIVSALTSAAPQAVPTGSEATQIASSHRPMAEPAAAAPSETFQEWWNTAGFAQYPAVDGKTVAEAAWIECALKSAAQQDINYRDALDLLRRAWNELIVDPEDTQENQDIAGQVLRDIGQFIGVIPGPAPTAAAASSETPRTDAFYYDKRGEVPVLRERTIQEDIEFASQLERRAEYWRAKCHKAWEDGDEQTRQRMQADASLRFANAAIPSGMALVCATCRFPVPENGERYCDTGDACPHRVTAPDRSSDG